MFRRRKFIKLGIVGFLVTLIPSKSQSVLANSSIPSESIAEIDNYLFDELYQLAIEKYQAILNNPRLRIEQKASIVNRLIKAYVLEKDRLIYESHIAIEHDISIANYLTERASSAGDNGLKYVKKAKELIPQIDSNNTFSANILLNAIVAESKLNASKIDLAETLKLIENISFSNQKIYWFIELANLLSDNQESLLKMALKEAETQQNLNGISLSSTYLGQLFLEQGELQKAFKLTNRAKLIANSTVNLSNSVRCYWQLGKLHLLSKNFQEAEDNYRKAIFTVQNLKEKELLSIQNKRELIEIYSEFLELLLDGQSSQNHLIESLKIADERELLKLENYFKKKCVQIKSSPTPLTELLGQNSVLLRFILLKKQSYIILVSSNGFKKFAIDLDRNSLKNYVRGFLAKIKFPLSKEYTILGKNLYNLFIEPLESTLNTLKESLPKSKPLKLIFVVDDFLKNLPFTTLINPKTNNFLIEDYLVTNSLFGQFPDLTLSIKDTEKITAFGLSRGKTPLPNVETELNSIKELQSTTTYLNETFTFENFEKSLRNQSNAILHLATHGNFNGLPDFSYLEIHQGKISPPELDKILSLRNHSIPLIVFSACQTASGNSDSIFGFAGTSFLSGIPSCIGTLWNIPDIYASKIMQKFYKYFIRERATLTAALRAAQLDFLKEADNIHPYKWAALILLSSDLKT
ncbi:MAG: CHAT domain-containing protein [Prochloraceae cyanobacterium]